MITWVVVTTIVILAATAVLGVVRVLRRPSRSPGVRATGRPQPLTG